MTRRRGKTFQRSLASALRRVRLVAMDVDGVLRRQHVLFGVGAW
jgi:hypothetical protein